MDDIIGSTQTYTDFSGLQQLRMQAQTNQESAVNEVARQFESVFTQMMIKSMRQANTPFIDEDMMSSEQTQFFQSMFDDQLSLQLAKTNSIGLADVISQQLNYLTQKKDPLFKANTHSHAAVAMATPTLHQRSMPSSSTPNSIDTAAPSANEGFSSPEDFIRKVWDSAKQVAETLGVDPKVLVAQAALETGWGSHIVRNAVGDLSYNLFGIKADKSWSKDSVTASTLESRNGIMQKENAEFRQYNSIAESFADYANFLQSNPRYQSALSKTANPYEYTRELQKAGYATDPHYAEKINSLIQNSPLKDLSFVK